MLRSLVFGVFYPLVILVSGYALGYFFATIKQHRLHMERLDALKKDLKQMDDLRDATRVKMQKIRDESWVSQLRN